MISESELLSALGHAIDDESFNMESSTENTENWDSLGQLGILATVSKLTGGKSDLIDEILTSQTARDLIDILRKNGIVA